MGWEDWRWGRLDLLHHPPMGHLLLPSLDIFYLGERIIIIIIIITAVISVVLYLNHKGEHTVLHKINSAYIKTSKIINYTVTILLFPTHHTCTHTQVHRRTCFFLSTLAGI